MIPPPNSLIDVSGATSFELSQQLLRLALRQSAFDHLVRHSPLPVKLMTLGKGAFIQLGNGSTHTGMNEGSARFDDDGDLIVETVTEPVEGHCLSLGLGEVCWEFGGVKCSP